MKFGPVVQEETLFIYSNELAFLGVNPACKEFLIWSSGCPFVQWSRTICATLVEGIMRNNSVKLFCFWTSGSGGNTFKIFLIWSSGGPFVKLGGTVCAILVEGIQRNNSVK